MSKAVFPRNFYSLQKWGACSGKCCAQNAEFAGNNFSSPLETLFPTCIRNTSIKYILGTHYKIDIRNTSIKYILETHYKIYIRNTL